MPFLFSRRSRQNSRSRISPSLDQGAIRHPMQTRRRPVTPPPPRNRWFTRRRRAIVPVNDDDVFGVDPIPLVAPIEVVRQNSSNKSDRKYPSVKEINVDSMPTTDVASEMPGRFAEVVDVDGRDCCLPGFFGSNCRICPESLQPQQEIPRLMHHQKREEFGGYKRKTKTKTKNSKKLKKRHHKKTIKRNAK